MSKNNGEMIPERLWKRKWQNPQHVHIFSSLALSHIPNKKRSKFDYQKVRKGISIRYSPNTIKHFRVLAPQTEQVVIASKLYIDESKKDTKLLAKWPLDVTMKRKVSAGELSPRGRLQKYLLSTEILSGAMIGNSEVIIGIEGKTSTPEVTMSITEANSKIHEPGSFDEAVNDHVHGRYWEEAIKERLQNLEKYQTWEYEKLPLIRKAIGLKWVFKVKYHPDGLITEFKARLVAQRFF